MDIRQLRCFVAVAETLHFGNAARQLNMLPASLSRHIRLLEEEFGAKLFARTTRDVSLTEAGALAVEPVRELIERYEKLADAVRRKGAVEGSVLRIGSIDSASIGLLPQLLHDFSREHPGIEVEILEQKGIRLMPKLLSGRLAVAFLRSPDTPDPRLEVRHLFSESTVVAVPEGHRLAARRALTVKDMADEPLIVPDRRSRPHSHDLTMRLFVSAGYTARVAQIAEEKQTIVNLVGAGIGLAIVPRWISRLSVEGVRYVPLRARSASTDGRLDLSAAWLRGIRDPVRDRLITTLARHINAYKASA